MAIHPSNRAHKLLAVIDLKAARANPDAVRAALARKGAAEAFDRLLAADERWRTLVPRVDELRARTKLKGKPAPEQLEELQAVKAELRAAEDELATAEAERDELALRVPNAPDDDVPDGSTDEDAREVRRVGEPATLADPRDHLELGRFEMERAARMSGARFGYWVGDTARLALALYRFALDRLAAKGFVTVLPPVLVREGALIGTGRSRPTSRTSTSCLRTSSTSRGRPRFPWQASTRERSSRPTSCRSATWPSHRASAARRARQAVTRAG